MTAPEAYIRRVLAIIAGSRAAIPGGMGDGPSIGTTPSVNPSTIRCSAIRSSNPPGISSTPSSVMNVMCSKPSTPAATASTMDCVPCACAVIGSPCRCASSTATRSSAGPNWLRSGRLPAVRLPPLAMILMTSTPRSTCSRIAARTPEIPTAGAPRKWQCPPGVVIGGPAATIVGSEASVRAASRRARLR